MKALSVVDGMLWEVRGFVQMQRLTRSCLVLLAVLMAGCDSKPSSNYGSLGLVSVGGRITLDGQPLAKAVVSFDDADGTFSFAQTDSSGYYRLKFDSEMLGCKPGKKTVRISTTRKILGLNSSEEGGETSSDEQAAKTEPPKELVPAKYYKKSELTADVTASNRSFNFELTSSASSGGGS